MTKRCSELPDQNSDPSKLPKLVCHSDVAEHIAAFMSSEKASSVSDITLISSDDVRIPAVRSLLVIRSSFFEKMLSRDCVESRNNVVQLPIPAATLRHLIIYWYTGDCQLVRKFYDHRQCDFAVEVIDLASAADYLGEEKLLEWCVETIQFAMEREIHILSCLLEHLTTKRAKWVDDNHLVEELLEAMGADATLNRDCECKLPHGVLHLGDAAMRLHCEKRLTPSAIGDYSSALFQALLIWVSNGTLPTVNKEYDFDEESCILVKVDQTKFLEERLNTAKYLAGKFDLSLMSPMILSEIVQKSGLVEEGAINEAFRKLAVRFEERERRALDARDKLQSKIYRLEQENQRMKLKTLKDKIHTMFQPRTF